MRRSSWPRTRAAAITGSVVDLTCGNAVRTAAGALMGVLA